MVSQTPSAPRMKDNPLPKESSKGMAPLAGTAWAAVASSIVDMMHDAGYGVEMWTAISNKAIHILSFGFVDDYGVYTTRPNNTV